MTENQKQALNKMKTVLDGTQTPAVIQTEGNDDFSTDVLSVLLTEYGYGNDEAMGEFFFIKDRKDSPISFFENVITLDEEVPTEAFENLIYATSFLNRFLRAGSFVLDASNHILMYKLVTPVDDKANEQQLFEQMDMSMGVALETAEPFTEILLKLEHGTASIDEVYSLFEVKQ